MTVQSEYKQERIYSQDVCINTIVSPLALVPSIRCPLQRINLMPIHLISRNANLLQNPQ